MPQYAFGHVTFSGDGSQEGDGPKVATVSLPITIVDLPDDDAAEKYMLESGYSGYVAPSVYNGTIVYSLSTLGV
jgi:hypothetical protein